MNDFESKLAQQAFRDVPSDLRRLILANVTSAPQPGGWREWLWPSPSAWGALAALWLIFFTFEAVQTRPESASRVAVHVEDQQPAPTLLIAHTPHELRRVLELTN